jgi:O-antigen/teichoic acid export membrane protein
MHRLAGNTLWQVGGKWFQFVVAVGVNIGVARYLGPESLGIFTYVLSVVTVLILFSQVGADLYLRMEMIRDPANEPAVIGSTLVLRVVAVALIYTGLIGYAWTLHRGEAEFPLLLIGGVGLLCMIPDVFRSYYVGHVRADVVAIADLKGFGVASALKIASILLGWPLAVFVVAGVIEWIVPGVLLALAYLRGEGARRLKRSFEAGMRILRESAPLYVSAICVSLYLRIDQLMLKWLWGPEELGYFAASARLVEKLYLVPVALGASFLPTIMGHKAGGDAGRYLANMRRFFELNVAVGYGVILGFLFGGTTLVVWALGPSYERTATIMSVQVMALPLMALGIARSQYLIAERMFHFAMWTNLGGVAINIVLNLLLIPSFGGVGAAGATLGTLALVHVGSSFLLRSTRGWGNTQVKALLIPLLPRRCAMLVTDMLALWRRRG